MSDDNFIPTGRGKVQHSHKKQPVPGGSGTKSTPSTSGASASGRGRGRGTPSPARQFNIDSSSEDEPPAPPPVDAIVHVEQGDPDMEALQQRNQELEQRLQAVEGLLNQGGAAGGQNVNIMPIAAAAAAVPAVQPRNISVTTFEENTQTMSAELWVSNLDRQRDSIQVTKDQMLNAALCALKGKAGLWRQNLELNDSPNIKDYDLFKQCFLKRFGRDRSASDLLALLHDVKQKQSETVRDFADKVNVHIRTMANTLVLKLPAVAPVNQTPASVAEAALKQTNRDEGYLLAFQDMKTLYFCSGLTEALRTRVEPKLSEIQSFDNLVEAACEFERTLKPEKTSSATISALEQQLKDNNKEIAQLKQFVKSSGGNSQGSQSQNSSSGSSTGSSNAKFKLAKKIVKRTEFVFCTKCKQWGKHRAPECRRPAKEIQALQAMDEEVKPSGTASDPFWEAFLASSTSQQTGN